MAYDASNSQPDQNQVVSSTPLSGGQQPAAQPQPSDSQPSQAPSQPSTIQSGMSSTQAGAQQQPQQQKKSASSGMFTNIQRYVQKNQPQAQKMSQAVTGNVRDTAKAVQEKNEQLQKRFQTQAQQSGVQGVEGAAQEVTAAANLAAGYQPQQPTQPDQTRQEYIDSNLNQRYEAKPATDPNQLLPDFGQTNFEKKQTVNMVTDPVTGEQRPENEEEIAARVAAQSQEIKQEIKEGKRDNPNKITLDQESPTIDDQRIQDILNMQYQGPMDIREMGDYGKLASEAAKADQLRQSALSGDKRAILQSTFGGGGGETPYTSGQSGLDSLLLGGQMEQIQKDIQGIQTGKDIISQARSQASEFAKQRSGFIDEQREAARSGLLGVAEKRRQEVDDRLSTVVENWDTLPEHFRNVFREAAGGGGVQLSQEEADMLGVGGSGLGIYNLAKSDDSLQNLFKATEADRSKLISQDEFGQLARLQALTGMARGDVGTTDIASEYAKSLQEKGGFELGEEKRGRAGTQSIQDALDVQNFQDQMRQAEQSFRKMAAKDITGKGKGQKTYSKGFMKGSGTIKRSATQTANLEDLLSKQGYDFDRDLSSMFFDPSEISQQQLQEVATSPNKANLTHEEMLYDNTLGGGFTKDIGSTAGKLTDDVLGVVGLQNLGVGKFIGDLGSTIGGIQSAIFGGGKTRAKQIAIANARKNALKDLQKKVQSAYTSSGFKNRLNIAESPELQTRAQGLQALLDKYR